MGKSIGKRTCIAEPRPRHFRSSAPTAFLQRRRAKTDTALELPWQSADVCCSWMCCLGCLGHEQSMTGYDRSIFWGIGVGPDVPNRMQILVLRLCLATPTWQSITGTSSPSDRYGHLAAAMTDGSVVFLGGPDSSASGGTWHLSLRNQSAAVWNKLPDPYSIGLLPSWNTQETPQHPTFLLIHAANHQV